MLAHGAHEFRDEASWAALDSLGPLHGYAIAARLEQVSGGALQLNMGTLAGADAAGAA
jgi:hypothetical protein